MFFYVNNKVNRLSFYDFLEVYVLVNTPLQPTYLVNPLIERKALVQVLPNWTPQEMDIFVLYPSRKHLSPTVRALIDFLSDYFQSHKWE